MGDYFSNVIGAVSDISLSLSEDWTILCNGEPVENTMSTSTTYTYGTSTGYYPSYSMNTNVTAQDSGMETVDEIYEKLIQKIECNKTEKEMKNETNKPKSGIPYKILPEITDVQIINNKVVILTFADGTTEKAVTDESDEFVFETGISICLMKKILSYFNGGRGTAAYNNLIEAVEKVYIKKQEAEREAERKAKEEKEAKQRRAAKAKAKREAKARCEQNRRINEQAEAYRRAFELMAQKKAYEAVDKKTTTGQPE